MEDRYSQPTLGVISSESRELQVEEGQDYFLGDNDKLPYTLLRNLGHGHSANVEMIQDRRTGSVYARKVFWISNPRDERRRIFENEMKIIRRLESHHHIIRVFATYVAKREVGLILSPVADRGDLGAFLHDVKEHNSVSVEERRILEMSFLCLSSGLSFMHKHKVRHKDIKPRNILIHQGSVIYTDFGYSLDSLLVTGSTTMGKPLAMTRKYCAPEVTEWEPRNSKSDIYSLGCVFLETYAALGALTLADGAIWHECLQEIQTALWEECEDRSDSLIADLIRRMLESDPSGRPSAETIAETLWLGQVYSCCSLCSSQLSKHYGHAPFDLKAETIKQDQPVIALHLDNLSSNTVSHRSPQGSTDLSHSPIQPERPIVSRITQYGVAYIDDEAPDLNIHRTSSEQNLTAPEKPGAANRRRASLTSQTFQDLFGQPSGTSDQGIAQPHPGPITTAAANAQRRLLSLTSIGLSGSTNQASPFRSARPRAERLSSANSGSEDESPFEDNTAPFASSNPATPFARRLSFGARALRDVRRSDRTAVNYNIRPPITHKPSSPPTAWFRSRSSSSSPFSQ